MGLIFQSRPIVAILLVIAALLTCPCRESAGSSWGTTWSSYHAIVRVKVCNRPSRNCSEVTAAHTTYRGAAWYSAPWWSAKCSYSWWMVIGNWALDLLDQFVTVWLPGMSMRPLPSTHHLHCPAVAGDTGQGDSPRWYLFYPTWSPCYGSGFLTQNLQRQQ